MHPQPARVRRLRRAHGHVCPACRTPWALKGIYGEEGFQVVCTVCSEHVVFVPWGRQELA